MKMRKRKNHKNNPSSAISLKKLPNTLGKLYIKYKKQQAADKLKEIKLKEREESKRIIQEKKELMLREEKILKEGKRLKANEEELKLKNKELKNKTSNKDKKAPDKVRKIVIKALLGLLFLSGTMGSSKTMKTNSSVISDSIIISYCSTSIDLKMIFSSTCFVFIICF